MKTANVFLGLESKRAGLMKSRSLSRWSHLDLPKAQGSKKRNFNKGHRKSKSYKVGSHEESHERDWKGPCSQLGTAFKVKMEYHEQKSFEMLCLSLPIDSGDRHKFKY